ncbi:MAG: Tetratricopeptide repeat protein [Gemmataceae bacterium]|nr:Tetratricopeptide repeat protein [Gemmataceae bacterium]
MSRARVSRPFPFHLALFILPVLSAAAPPAADHPDDLIRRANAAFLRGDGEAADGLYAAAEERTGDPGLVAFNKAAVLFQRGEFYSAELHYARTLDDKICPPDRAARAWFNRGTCLLRRGGAAAVYRSAVACFDRCLDLDPADDPLKADARHNLELAKLLWADANRKAAKPDSPNVPPPESQAEPPPPQPAGSDQQPATPDAGDGSTGPNNPRQTQSPIQGALPRTGAPRETTTPTAGNNHNLQPLKDDDRVEPRPPEDTREYLRRTHERLCEERKRMLRMLYGPDRPGVRDW